VKRQRRVLMGRAGPEEVKSPAAKTFEKNGGENLWYSSVVEHMPNM
jgi:hypothetical protein